MVLFFGKHGFMSNPKPDKTELEMITDCGPAPVPRTPAQGVLDMRARIEKLTSQRGGILLTLESHPGNADVLRTLRELDEDLQTARARLTEYETQLNGLN
jgi:hypothetical protein